MKHLHIFIIFNVILLCFSSEVFGQRTISGNVSDASGSPLPFANVFIEGTTIGTTTDIEGDFVLKIPQKSQYVTIGYAGYNDKTFKIIDSNYYDIVMKGGRGKSKRRKPKSRNPKAMASSQKVAKGKSISVDFKKKKNKTTVKKEVVQQQTNNNEEEEEEEEEERKAFAALENLEKGKIFLETNALREGVQVMASGLQYEVLEKGDGPNPNASDRVKTHYHGTLIDGTVFDSSVERGQPITLPIMGAIKGWREALQLMTVGSKWRIFVPTDLAYGKQTLSHIPPNSTLIFDIELLELLGDTTSKEVIKRVLLDQGNKKNTIVYGGKGMVNDLLDGVKKVDEFREATGIKGRDIWKAIIPKGEYEDDSNCRKYVGLKINIKGKLEFKEQFSVTSINDKYIKFKQDYFGGSLSSSADCIKGAFKFTYSFEDLMGEFHSYSGDFYLDGNSRVYRIEVNGSKAIVYPEY